MWFENAIGKEKIKFMFNNELNINDVEVDNFSLERFSDLKFRFYCKDIPKKYPEKWNEEGFNALSLVVTFGDVIKLDVTGSRVGFFCTPIISSLKEFSEITIKHHDLDFYCKAKFLTIESITPYIDERWD
ncbi:MULTISPECIES: Imm50 family immunity protein [Serratia]|uniref:Imm50 family immunity protein n=1 Tax=Serratia TaxID=613 RepID=UPI001013C6E7|nr:MULTISPECIES: Imm50 family immunity protein [Serratia]